MVKTQVQIPDHLYKEAKRIAAEYELSFAEVVRRGLERVVPAFPPRTRAVGWAPPEPRALGCKDLTAAKLRDLARGDDELPQWWSDERKGQK